MDEARVGWSQIESLYRAQFLQFERVARAITGDSDSALEAVQEGFADALRHSDQWSGRGSIEGWVWRCVVNRARKTRRRPVLEQPVDEQRNDEVPAGSELAVRLAALPERQRLVVFLRYFADLEYREIGVALGIETGTVAATLHAAHASLRAGYEEALA
jgi:RNA polymerase sigma-70 factor (ECF subfamily)